MPNNIIDGLSLVDSTGRLILATTLGTLILGIGVNLVLRARYAALEADLAENAAPRGRFTSEALNAIVRSAEAAAGRSAEPNTQAIIEDHFQSQLGGLLLAERFVRAATGLVIILGLLGTFYGLTSSIGRLVQLVAGEPAVAADVTQGVTSGLTQALSGMAVAFSNSLVGILSAVLLTVLGILSNPTDRRVALMVRIETYLDRLLSDPAFTQRVGGGGQDKGAAGFGEAVERLEAVVGRFDAALTAFSESTREFSEFNAHLKDNVQRMSLGFADLGDALKTELTALKREKGR